MTPTHPLGALPHENGTHFSLWALGRTSALVEVNGCDRYDMIPIGEGYFAVDVAGVLPGAMYSFSVDGGPPLPDLASRWQPEGSDGLSEVVDERFAWTDHTWSGLKPHDQVIYELHVGTFTREGTWQAAAERLQWLKELGITVLQIMPINTFKGGFGWGYDTTFLYAPYAEYGSPDDLRSFVDAAHRYGIGIILDVVYNHVGIGEYFSRYSEHYFSKEHVSEWGHSFNFDGLGSRAVRDFITGNAAYWIEAFHLDGLRIDAAQALVDSSHEHILTDVSKAVRRAGGDRLTYLVVENQPQEKHMIASPLDGGHGLDAMYSDDFHHAVHVAAAGHNDFYYADYRGTAQEILSALKYGFLYQGQRSNMRSSAYGTYNLDTPAHHFVHFLENHDQVANSARGWRLSALVSPARYRAMTALLLLGPQTPCLFQGQEFGSTLPFNYFLGLEGEEARAVADGRRDNLSQFASVADPQMQKRLSEPSARATFEQSKLDWREASLNEGLVRLHKDLLARRTQDSTFRQNVARHVDGAVIGESAFLLRYITPDAAGHRILLVNFGRDIQMAVTAEPLLAPPQDMGWELSWSSEHPDYDGAGRVAFNPRKAWLLPSDCALLLSAVLPAS